MNEFNMNIIQLFKVEVYLMNLRNTAFLTLSLLAIAPVMAQGAASAGAAAKSASAVEAKSLYARMLDLAKSAGASVKSAGKSVANHWAISGAAVATTAGVVAYKTSPKVKAKVDAAVTTAKTKAVASYDYVRTQLAALDNKPFTRADAVKGGLVAALGYVAYASKDAVTGHVKAGYNAGYAKTFAAYDAVKKSSAVAKLSALTTQTKVAAAAAVAVSGALVYKAVDYIKNRNKAAAKTKVA
jgi:hypothetical protein